LNHNKFLLRKLRLVLYFHHNSHSALRSTHNTVINCGHVVCYTRLFFKKPKDFSFKISDKFHSNNTA